MANYTTLKASVNAYIKANGVRAITGPVLNGILTQMINTLGDGARYGGIATPSGNPGTHDNVVFFVATAAGTYTNYGGFTLDGKTVHVLVYDGSWTDVDTGVPTSTAFATKADKDEDAVEGNIAMFDSNGNPVDGGVSVDALNQLGQEIFNMIGGEYSPTLTLEQGSIKSADGTDEAASNRIRTSNYIVADGFDITTSGSKVYVLGYAADGTYIGAQGWLSESKKVKIDGACKYRLIFANSDNSNITPADYPSLGITTKAIWYENFTPELEWEIDFSIYQHIGYVITSDNKWQTSGAYYGIFVPVLGGSRIKAVPKINTDGYIAVLKDTAHTNGETPHFATGYSSRTMISTEELLSIPDDAKYLYICLKTSAGVVDTRFYYMTQEYVKEVIGIPVLQAETTKDRYETTANKYVDEFATAISTDTTITGRSITQGAVGYFRITCINGGVVKNLRTYNNSTQVAEVIPASGVPFVAGVPQYFEYIAASNSNRFRIGECPAGTQIEFYVPAERKDGVNKLKYIPDELAELTDKASSITFTSGGYYDGACSYKSGSSYAYSSALEMKKGDVLLVELGAALAVDRNYIFRCTDTGTPLYVVGRLSGIYSGVSTSGGKFVCPEDGYYMFNIRVHSNNVYHWYRKVINSDNQFAIENTQQFYPPVDIVPAMRNMSMTSGITGGGTNRFMLLHFSDIHGHPANLYRIRDFFAKYSKFGIKDAICTGDMSPSKYPDYNPTLWAQDGNKTILQVIGNHDVYDAHGDAPGSYDDPNYWATPAEKYSQYIAPNVDLWNVTQPDDAEANGYCYYYKDYDMTNGSSVGGVRLICLDAMAFDATQLAWLVETLADAKTNGLQVMIADHFTPTLPNNIQGFDTPFFSLQKGMEFSYASTNLPGATAAVDDFIEAGGIFIAWICGHMHYDMVGVTSNHPKQCFIAVATCGPVDRYPDTYRGPDCDYDCMNLYSIDLDKKVLSVLRIGGEYDMWLRHRKTMAIQYGDSPRLLWSY